MPAWCSSLRRACERATRWTRNCLRGSRAQIPEYDHAVEQIAHAKYPETVRLRQIPGVGPVTALQFVLTLGDPYRFRRSRDVGAFLGLVPRRRQSGANEPQLRISKAGNGE